RIRPNWSKHVSDSFVGDDTLAGSARSDLVLRHEWGPPGNEEAKNRRQTETTGGFRGNRCNLCRGTQKSRYRGGYFTQGTDTRPIRTRPANLDSRSRRIEDRRRG